PKVAPKLPESETRVPTPEWVKQTQAAYSRNMALSILWALVRPGPMLKLAADGKKFTYLTVLRNALAVLFPLLLTVACLWGTWWYVVIHQQEEAPTVKTVKKETKPGVAAPAPAKEAEKAAEEEKPVELGAGTAPEEEAKPEAEEQLQEMGSPELATGTAAPAASGPAPEFYW